MPLAWREVTRGLDPSRFTVRTVPGLLTKTKAWAGYCDGERALSAAIGRMGG
jgi:bifunctional non-homologous end joining protein LigD